MSLSPEERERLLWCLLRVFTCVVVRRSKTISGRLACIKETVGDEAFRCARQKVFRWGSSSTLLSIVSRTLTKLLLDARAFFRYS